MRRMLISSAVALALVATMGVHEASAQKGKEKRNPGNPLRVKITIENLTTMESGKEIMASGGDEVSIRLRVENRTGEAQTASIHIVGGVPGCMYDETILEAFLSGEKKEQTVVGTVPEGESGLFTVDVDVLMPKTADMQSDGGTVAFGGMLKGAEPSHASMWQRLFGRLVVRRLIQLDGDGTNATAATDMSSVKQLFR